MGSNHQSVELEIEHRKMTLRNLGDQLAQEPDEKKRDLLTRKIWEEDNLLKVPFKKTYNIIRISVGQCFQPFLL